MKQKLVALLLVSIMAVSALGAIGLTTTRKAEAASSYSLTLSVSTMNPQPGEAVYLYGKFTNGGKPIAYTTVDIYKSRDNSAALKWTTVVTDKNGFFRTTYRFPANDLGHSSTFQASRLTFRYTRILPDGIPLTISQYSSSFKLTVWCKWSTYLTLGMLSPSKPLVAHGQKYAVKGTLTDSRGLLMRQEPVKLVWGYQSKPGWKPWTTVRTDARGFYTAIRSDFQSVQLYAQFSGDATHWGSNKMIAVQIE